MASKGYEGKIQFWDTVTWENTRTLDPQLDGFRGLLFSPDEKTMALSLESQGQLWDVAAGEKVTDLPVSTKVISAMTFSPDGKIFIIGGADKKIRVWS